MEWQIISEAGNPKKSGRYGIIYWYRNRGRHIYLHIDDFIMPNQKWVGMSSYAEVLAWCEFPAIPSQFII
jgi:hypothetical protein